MENLWKKKSQRRTKKQLERFKIGSNKTCIREDVVKENMMISQESSQAIFEMGDVELIQLKQSEFTAQNVHTMLLKQHFVFFAHVGGKHIRLDQEMTRHIKAAFEILEAPSSVRLWLLQGVIN